MLRSEARSARRTFSFPQNTRARVAAIRAAAGWREMPDFCRQVRDVVIIASSSRGGSSVLSEVLRRSGAVLSLRGELNPFLVLNRLTFPLSGTDSDLLDGDVSANAMRSLSEDLAYDCGTPCDVLASDADVWRFSAGIAARLTMQWPLVELDLHDIHRLVDETLRTLWTKYGWRKNCFEDLRTFQTHFLLALKNFAPEIDPYAYDDVDASLFSRVGLEKNRFGPPSPILIEEPPYISAGPWRHADAAELRSRTLVIKTPSNVYRMGFLRRLFPAATVRVLHLTRNAAASINGLYDGWQHDGFFSHAVPVPLSIHGYSDLHPNFGDCWWKFDLPPGWREKTALPLEQVCAWQWKSAHEAIRKYVEESHLLPDEVFRVRFEELADPARRHFAFDRMMKWIDPVHGEMCPAGGFELPVVMATQPPTFARWKKRAEMIAPLVAEPSMRELMKWLGYKDVSEWR